MARGKYKGPKRGAGQRNRTGGDVDEIDERRPEVGQSANAGMMPPSDSESEDEAPNGKQNLNMFAGMGAPGEMPPNSSDEDDSDESDDEPVNEYLAAPSAARRKKQDEPDPAQLAADMERLKLIKEKREQQRLERIRTEGWDRYAPVTETNKPPDGRTARPANGAEADSDDD